MLKYRKELKFILPETLLSLLETRLKSVLKTDEHQVGDYYIIRSVYFDSPCDECLVENKAGVGMEPRRKYRIRAYGNLNPKTHMIELSDRKISAEIKLRYRDSISKKSADITRDQFDKILKGDYSWLHSIFSTGLDITQAGEINKKKEVLGIYLEKIAGEHYRPKTIVDYKRTAYIYGPSNVRITFDRDINASTNYASFFSNNLHGVPVMKAGFNVLEVKYDEFLPDEIKMLLDGINLERTSCSKYCLCRETNREYRR